MILVLIALLVYFALGIVLAVNVYFKLAKAGKPWVVRIGAVLGLGVAIWAVPFGDHTLGKLEYMAACTKDAGTKIYRAATNVEGFLDQFASANSPRQDGYRFREQLKSDGTVTRFTLQSDGQVLEERGVSSISMYSVEVSRSRVSAQLSRSEYVVFDLEKKESLARYVQYGHAGGWLYRQLEAMHAYREVCPSKAFNYTQFIRSVLKPTAEGR